MTAPPPPRAPRGTRTGFTTGACVAAAAKAATRVLVRGELFTHIETVLPNRERVTFELHRCERVDGLARCSVIKDAGDDPDCTHGAELVAEVRLEDDGAVVLEGGRGVGVVTKEGLGLEVGGAAINPVPRKNITEMVRAELPPGVGARVTVHVPRGEELAKQTLNARLGIQGGISILGTTGIVKPYSTAAYKASVVQAIDVARARGNQELVLTTGGKSEQYAMALMPQLPEEAFIQVGDFIGVGVRHAARQKTARILVVGMIGKLSKMADGRMQTHAAGSEVNLALLASLAAELGAPQTLVEKVQTANTARHVLELCAAHGLMGITSAICRKVVENCTRYANAPLKVRALLVDFNGALLGEFPPAQKEAA